MHWRAVTSNRPGISKGAQLRQQLGLCRHARCSLGISLQPSAHICFLLAFRSSLLMGQKLVVAHRWHRSALPGHPGRNPCLAEGSVHFEDLILHLKILPAPGFPWIPVSQVTNFPWKGKPHFSEQPHLSSQARGTRLVFRGAQQPGQLKYGIVGAQVGREMQHGKAPCRWSLHFCWFMPQRGALGVSSPASLSFLVSLETKKYPLLLNIIYWANTGIGELLVNSSFFLLFNPVPHWLQEGETSSFCAKGVQRHVP